jgi:hypothetical protein
VADKDAPPERQFRDVTRAELEVEIPPNRAWQMIGAG